MLSAAATAWGDGGRSGTKARDGASASKSSESERDDRWLARGDVPDEALLVGDVGVFTVAAVSGTVASFFLVSFASPLLTAVPRRSGRTALAGRCATRQSLTAKIKSPGRAPAAAAALNGTTAAMRVGAREDASSTMPSTSSA